MGKAALAWTALALVAAAGCMQQGAAAPDYDCNAGCPLSGDGVCGKDEVTYVNDCVRECAGNTPHDYSGPCDDSGNSMLRNAGSGAKAPPQLADTVLGAYLKTSVTVRATKAQMERFSAEGLSLIGAARTYEAGKGAGSGSGATKPPGPATASASLGPLDSLLFYNVRITADLLVYASKPIQTTGRALLASMPTTATLPGSPPTEPAPSSAAVAVAGDGAGGGGPLLLVAAGPSQEGGPDGATATQGASDGGGAGIARKTDDPEMPGFTRVTSSLPYPYTAVGQLAGTGPLGFNHPCTGSLVGNAVVLTGASCVWVKDGTSSGFVNSITFSPHLFCPKEGLPSPCFLTDYVRPFGTISFDSVNVRAGYIKRGSRAAIAWQSSSALILLKQLIGKQTGFLGVGFTKGTLSKSLYTAGYPGDFTSNEYYKLSSPCPVRDTAGSDQTLLFKPYPPPPKDVCLTSCAISRPGQGGQPVWSIEANGDNISWGVLSYGPRVGTCQGSTRTDGYDTYYQLDALDFKWISGCRGWDPLNPATKCT